MVHIVSQTLQVDHYLRWRKTDHLSLGAKTCRKYRFHRSQIDALRLCEKFLDGQRILSHPETKVDESSGGSRSPADVTV